MPDTRQTPLQMHRFIIGIVIRGIRMIYKNSLTKGNSHSGMVVANVACFRASFLVGVPCITGKILKAAYPRTRSFLHAAVVCLARAL